MQKTLYLIVFIVICPILIGHGCSGGSGGNWLPVGSPCTNDSECSGPGTPQCLTEGLYPLKDLADSDNPTARGLAEIGVEMPGGYCSTVPPCSTDADCGQGGSCYFPLRNVDADYFKGLVGALGLGLDDAAVLEGFLQYGQCLKACNTDSDCGRAGYVCATPLEDFLALVQGADMGTYCIGAPAASCDPNPCIHGACSLVDGEPTCTCQAGWEGKLCDTNHDDCTPNPCQNGGTCTDQVNGYSCTCPQGYSGSNCENAVSGCADNPCLHGTCEDIVGGYSCTCDPGWTGTNCDTDFPDCDADPCVHGTCSEGAPGTGEFTCACETGWEGKLCDTNHDDCTPNPCQNGGTCTTDQVNGYSCTCPPGYSGTNCEITETTYCILTYALVVGNSNDGSGWTGCNIRIRDTFAGMGDGTHAIGPGLLKIRVPSDGGQNPVSGTADILYYELTQEFTTTTAGTTIATDVTAFCPELGATGNTAAQATGVFTTGASPTITWEACTYPAGYNNSNTSFTPDVVGTGPGCLAPYRSVGNVNCSGSFCNAGGLQSGDNPQDETWEQALQTLTFTADLSALRMDFMLVPNRSPSRTYISWEGTLSDIICLP